MKTITKKHIISQISKEKRLDPKVVQLVIQEFFSEILKKLKDGDR